jgi:hypothetical protein
MHTIALNLEAAAPLSSLQQALRTADGYRGWLNVQTRVEAPGRFTFPFGPRVVTFTLDRADERGVELTCVAHQNNPDWLGTHLALTLTPAGEDRTRIALAHSGYRDLGETYQRCVPAWEHFLKSLASYAATGKGMPFDEMAVAA